MQLYIHPNCCAEFGGELPVQKEDHKAHGDYAVRLTGGHARWSVHSNQVDNIILLRLQRGESVIFISHQHASAWNIQDGERVEAYNDAASF